MEFLAKNIDKNNIMLVDMLYSYGNKDNDYTDTLDIVYRDLKTGEKKLKTIEKPPIEIYFTKPEYRDYTHNKNYIEISKTDKHLCPIRNIPFYIAKQAGDEYQRMLKEGLMNKDGSASRKMHFYPYVFGSDMGAEEFYRINWLLEYDNETPKPITKSYFDIEVDTINIAGFPKMGECPVNIISFLNEENKSVYSFILNEKSNPLIKEFVENIDDVIKEAHQMFDEVYGSFDYNVYMYDNEDELIRSFYKCVNTLKPDFIMGWNEFGWT